MPCVAFSMVLHRHRQMMTDDDDGCRLSTEYLVTGVQYYSSVSVLRVTVCTDVLREYNKLKLKYKL